MTLVILLIDVQLSRKLHLINYVRPWYMELRWSCVLRVAYVSHPSRQTQRTFPEDSRRLHHVLVTLTPDGGTITDPQQSVTPPAASATSTGRK